MGGDGEDVQRVRKLNRNARKARASQNPKGMILAEIPEKGEGEPVG
uniref:Uncharacterized protein n=1 Tax=Trichinella nativa TaxID=6335 RepID=A0A0V1IQA8_9BILA